MVIDITGKHRNSNKHINCYYLRTIFDNVLL